MKILSFIKWQWNKWAFWQKCFIVGSSFAGAALTAPEPYITYLATIPIAIIFGFTFKWYVWDGVITSYKEFKQEQQDLFTKIKNSDDLEKT